MQQSGDRPGGSQEAMDKKKPAAGIEGYSAENAFVLARSRLQPVGIQQFWETGFWNDFIDPNKDLISLAAHGQYLHYRVDLIFITHQF